ncbi:hypothetical protein [Collimonas sp.]|uniref:hypothetical protein n=1 Tax=Collimonas sp. TaxID=1963772 RepID=UPI002D7E22CC|nr:hypothetical protein [Collimonas sp.]
MPQKLVEGFQWINGSFSEDVEMFEDRYPKSAMDVDILGIDLVGLLFQLYRADPPD